MTKYDISLNKDQVKGPLTSDDGSPGQLSHPQKYRMDCIVNVNNPSMIDGEGYYECCLVQ